MMASATNNSMSINSVFIRLRVKWQIKVEEIAMLSTRLASLKLNSSIFHPTFIQNGRFNLSFQCCPDKYYEICVNGDCIEWKFELENPFILNKGRAFAIRSYNVEKLPFLKFFNNSCAFLDDAFTIYCVVHIRPRIGVVRFGDAYSPREFRDTVKFETLPYTALPGNYTDKEVVDFIQKGIFPSLDVDKAIKIIRDVERHECVELELCCVEYLMKNVTEQNFQKIMQLSIDMNLQFLGLFCRTAKYRGFTEE